MKNPIFALILLIITLSACHRAEKKLPVVKTFTPVNYKPVYPDASSLIQAYNRFLAGLDTVDLHASRVAYHEFLDKFSGQSPQVYDTAFLLFWDFQTSLQRDSLMLRMGGEVLDTLWTAEHEGAKLPDSLKVTLEELHEDLFSLNMEEGSAYLRSSWELAAPRFLPYVSQPTKELLVQNTKEEKEGFMDDAALQITAKQLAKRTVWWEQYIDKYPHYAFVDAAQANYNNLMYLVMTGVDNTPLVREDSVFEPYYDTVYTFIRDSFPKTRTNATITPYRQAWRSRDTATIRRMKDSVQQVP